MRQSRAPNRTRRGYAGGRVATNDAACVVELTKGKTCTGGNANGGSFPDYYGGGMYNNGSSPAVAMGGRISSFIQRENWTSGDGRRARHEAPEMTKRNSTKFGKTM